MELDAATIQERLAASGEQLNVLGALGFAPFDVPSEQEVWAAVEDATAVIRVSDLDPPTKAQLTTRLRELGAQAVAFPEVQADSKFRANLSRIFRRISLSTMPERYGMSANASDSEIGAKIEAINIWLASHGFYDGPTGLAVYEQLMRDAQLLAQRASVDSEVPQVTPQVDRGKDRPEAHRGLGRRADHRDPLTKSKTLDLHPKRRNRRLLPLWSYIVALAALGIGGFLMWTDRVELIARLDSVTREMAQVRAEHERVVAKLEEDLKTEESRRRSAEQSVSNQSNMLARLREEREMEAKKTRHSFNMRLPGSSGDQVDVVVNVIDARGLVTIYEKTHSSDDLITFDFNTEGLKPVLQVLFDGELVKTQSLDVNP